MEIYIVMLVKLHRNIFDVVLESLPQTLNVYFKFYFFEVIVWENVVEIDH